MPDNSKIEVTGDKSTSSKVTVVRDNIIDDSYRKWTQVAWACAALAIAIAVAWAIILLTTRLSSSTNTVSQLSEANSQIITQNAELQAQLDELGTAGQTAREVSACFNVFTNKITQANANFSTVALGDMFVDILRLVLADNPEYSGEVPSIPEVLENLDAVDDAKTDYNDAISARAQWIADGSPLPCPIDEV